MKVLFTTIFLIPYITIQIKGAAILFSSAFPVGEGYLFWSCVIVGVMFLYSSFGGIKAIYVTDAIQGLIMLFVVWVIALFVLKNAGGVEQLFLHVEQTNKALLSLPGPSGVLNWQFLLISFISISLMPYTQPQLTTRMLVAKSDKIFLKAGLFFCVFVILVITPTIFIGFQGSLMGKDDFLLEILQTQIPPIFYALFIIGVLSASMSTSDSQLMAIGTEWASLLSKDKLLGNKNAKLLVKLTALFCSIAALILAQSPFKSLILFSINSFIGTSFLLPIIYSIKAPHAKNILALTSFICVSVFMTSLLGFVPKYVLHVRIELILYVLVGFSILLFAKPKRS